MSTIESLDAAPRTLVFRAIEGILREDPVLSKVIRKDSLRAWKWLGVDPMPFGIVHVPALRISKATSADRFATPDTMKGGLIIKAEILLRGGNTDHMDNFWWAICRAFYPVDPIQRSRICTRLQNAGARSGLIVFDQPAYDMEPDGELQAGTGAFLIDIESRFN